LLAASGQRLFFSYRGQHYSVPHAYAEKTVLVKEPVRGAEITV
jgi:hypothetical protein